MATGTSVYRVLVRLYPRSFRDHYADDLVLHFEDLARRDGARRAWRRTAVDLLVTVPRYRMETIILLAAALVCGVVGLWAVRSKPSSSALSPR